MQESLEELQARTVSDLGGGPHLQRPERDWASTTSWSCRWKAMPSSVAFRTSRWPTRAVAAMLRPAGAFLRR